MSRTSTAMGILHRLLGEPEVDRPSTDRLLRAGRSPARRVYVVPSRSRADRALLENVLAALELRPGTDRADDRILALSGRPAADEAALRDILAGGGSAILLPCLVVWHRAPERLPAGWRGVVLGSHDRPTVLRRVLDVGLRSRSVFLQVGPPVDPREGGSAPGRRRVRRLLGRLRRSLEAERRVVSGPPLPTPGRLRRAILDAPGARRRAREIAERLELEPGAVRRRLRRELDAMAARVRFPVVLFLRWLLAIVWTRIYRGVDLPEEDLEAIRAALRRGSAILLPAHRSHLDYLLLSWLLFTHRISVPHIVAGDNLDVPVLGPILRRGGGFFIRRSFRDDPVFGEVLDRYLRTLVRHDVPIEVFIEGGRSRSGRLLPPRLGILGRLLDAAATHRRGRDVTFLPLAITYERVAEARTFAREQQGARKQPESLSLLLRARRVLDEDHGRVMLRLGEPLLASQVVDGGDGSLPWTRLEPGARQDRVKELGREIAWRISRAQIVLGPHLVALALRGAPSAEVDHEELKARLLRFREVLRRCRANLAPEIERVDAGLAEALLDFEDRGWIERSSARRWLISPQHLVDLELTAGPALTYFAEAGLAALAVQGGDRQRFRAEDLREAFTGIRRRLAAELVLPPDVPDAAVFRDGLAILAATGALRRSSEGYETGSERRLGEIARLLEPIACGHLAFLLETPEVLAAAPAPAPSDLVRVLLRDRREIERRWGFPALSVLRTTLENAAATALDEGLLERTPTGLRADAEAFRSAARAYAFVLGIAPSREPRTEPGIPPARRPAG